MKNFQELMERMYNLNAMLEVCQMSTQADALCVESLDVVLCCLHSEYMELYGELLAQMKGVQ